MKTLILGGYGNFGARICRALAAEPSVQLLVGGRDLIRAKALASELGHGSQPVAIDHTSEGFSLTLRRLGIELLVHTAGPFQHQGYGVALAAASAGVHYIDLADGRRFVCDFPAEMDETFKTAGRSAISGASTVPALSSAVVDDLCGGWQRIDSIDMCIAPAQTAPRGEATMAAVLSYCGESIPVWEDGRWQLRRGWTNPERVSIAGLRDRLGALCDIPDLELFPEHYGVRRSVMFRAAVEVGIAQRAFAVLAGLRAVGLVKRPARMAGVLNRAARLMDFMGSSLGGMVVRVEGINASGALTRRSWHIAADDDHGPEIPCMAAVLLARRIARGHSLGSGASTCIGILKLADFEPEFTRWGMVTKVLEST